MREEVGGVDLHLSEDLLAQPQAVQDDIRERSNELLQVFVLAKAAKPVTRMAKRLRSAAPPAHSSTECDMFTEGVTVIGHVDIAVGDIGVGVGRHAIVDQETEDAVRHLRWCSTRRFRFRKMDWQPLAVHRLASITARVLMHGIGWAGIGSGWSGA
jgi:hypothetical protein